MSLRIGIEGVGQMGLSYLEKLRELGFDPADIVIWDTKPEKMSAAQHRFSGIRPATSFEDFAGLGDAYIVAVNTPSHHVEIERLAMHGVQHVLRESGLPRILSEKPLADSVVSLRKIRALQRAYRQLNVYTALVISFSETRQRILKLMKDEGLTLRVFGGRWGKNRGKSTELRPTAGDRVDEFIHMTEFGLGLVRSHGVRHVDVTAQVEYLAYANEQAQREAHERDSSFPLRPDHSTQALLCAATNHGEVQMCLASSFLEAKQVRTVWGTLAVPGSDEPVYSFSIDFDVKGADKITLTPIRSDTPEETTLPCDKLRVLTESFLRTARGEVADDRLAPVDWAGFFVEIMEAIGMSDKLRREIKPSRLRVSYVQEGFDHASRQA